MTDSQPSDTPKNLEELSKVIDHLENNLNSISRSQISGRTTVLIGSLVLLAMIGIFGINLFQTLKTQINEETLQAALQAKADELLPTLQEKFTKAAMEAVPTYRELAMERLRTLRPQLQEMITNEAKSLADSMPAMLREKANDSLQRVTDKVAADIKTEIPSLTPETVRRLSDITVKGMAIESEKIQQQLQTLTNGEIKRISKLLDTLPIESAMNMDEELLQQRFIHNMLLIIDRAVAPSMSTLRTDSPFSTRNDLSN